MPQLVKHLTNHDQYLSIFESYFLEITQTFYEAESVERYESLRADAREFLKHCEARRTEEKERARAVLPEASWEAVVQATDRALLTGRLDWLAKDGASPLVICWVVHPSSFLVALRRLMTDKATERLSLMYKLFARVEGQKVLCAAYKAHVQVSVYGAR